MKPTAILFILLFAYSVHAQVELGLKIGASPGTRPNTNTIIANRSNINDEFLFDITEMGNGKFAGFDATVHMAPFFVRFEALLNERVTEYRMQKTRNIAEPSMEAQYMTERVWQLDNPLSIGINLGKFQIFSGFTVHTTLSETKISGMPGMRSTLDTHRFAWHSGFGFNLENVLFEVRYVQDFNNYGSHLHYGDERMTFYNAPGYCVIMAGYRFGYRVKGGNTGRNY